MKKIYFSLLSIFGVFAVNAQLTEANNAPAHGDTYTIYRCDSTTTSPGASGAGAMWNFASITTYSNLMRTYATVSLSNPPTYTAANRGVSSATNDAAYLASSSSSLTYYGGNISVGAIVGNITYTSPAIYASYPMTLNTTATAAIGGTLYIPSLSLNGSFSGNSSVLADGTGTISLPGTNSTFTNTLRVVTSQTLFINSTFATATVTQINYNYYGSGIKAPVFTISTATAVIVSLAGNSTTTQTMVARNKDAVVVPTPTDVSVKEYYADNTHFTVFPNPSNTSVNFVSTLTEAKVVSVYDITGKLVEKQNLNDGKVKMDVSSFNKGLYLYTISSGDNGILKSGKITVSH